MISLVAIAATACAPAYQPSALNAPMLQEKGDLHLGVATGTPGVQLHGAYAMTDQVAMRGLAQAYSSSNNRFHLLSAGLSFFGASGRGLPPAERDSGLRWAMSLDSGLADARGFSSITLGNRTSETVHEGTVVRSAFQADLGFETPRVGLGAGARLSHVVLFHSEGSDRAGETGNALYLEPIVYVRPGFLAFKLDLQIGVVAPIGGQDGVGTPVPLMVSLGGTFDR